MAAVYSRINAVRPRPSDHINFVAVNSSDAEPEMALAVLEQIAAFLDPILSRFSLTVGRLTDADWNAKWNGRNWAKGQHIELVLRRKDGNWRSWHQFVKVALHELAHNLHTAHNSDFDRFLRNLTVEAEELQCRGWSGAGFWGKGRTLSPHAPVSPVVDDALFTAAAEEDDLLACATTSPAVPPAASLPPAPSPSLASTSSSSPSATRATRKASASTGPRRVKPKATPARSVRKTAQRSLKDAFASEGRVLGGDGSSKGKRAASQRAREERAEAAIERARQAADHTAHQQCECITID